jgi:hypothetical protein
MDLQGEEPQESQEESKEEVGKTLEDRGSKRSMLKLIEMAGKVALPTNENDQRAFLLGSVGIRRDGTLVSARNGAVRCLDTDEYQHIPSAHAEWRLGSKLGKYGTVYVARVAKSDGNLVMARPCITCQIRLRSLKVERAFYSINPDQYGIYFPMKDYDRVYQA